VGRRFRVPVSVLDPAERAVVEVGGREVVLFRVDGRVHAFDNACPHEGNPLSEGEIAGETLTCVYHLWRFDLASGACLQGDAPARRHSASVRGREIVLELED